MRFSQDMEDILSVIDGHLELLNEMKKAPHAPKKFVSNAFENLLKHSDLLEETALGFIRQVRDPQKRVNNIMTKIEEMARL